MMRRWLTAAAAAGMMLGIGLPAGAQAPAAAPGWNDSTTIALVSRAVARRAQQLADTGLRDYRARANGYLTFLGQLGEGFTTPPRILKADQLALEVYWRAPDESKQRIVGRRDTLLAPTDINYHRDHLGIVQNNFPDIIRLGDGDEVRDVPHPLSPRGLQAYDFQIRDSLQIRLPGRVLDVYEVRVRPRDDRLARVIGAVFLERESAQVVRMAFSFTTAAFLDRNLEDLSIVLENGLVGARFWLPRRQEIEIRRRGTWLDYPARGIIRGRWEIGEYELNQDIPPATFAGPEIVQAPAAQLRAYPWQGAVLDSLPPDVRAVTDAEVARVQAEARELVREQALQRGRGTSVAARAISDLLRANRVEGLALGAGATRRFGGGVSATGRLRYGTEDERLKGGLAVTWQRASGVGFRVAGWSDHPEAGDAAERSGVVNSIAAQEFGSDHSDPYESRGLLGEMNLGTRLGIAWRVGGSVERHGALRVHASPAWGRFDGTLAFPRLDVARGFVRAERPTMLGPLGTEVRFDGEVRVSRFDPVEGAAVEVPEEVQVDPGFSPAAASTVARALVRLDVERPFGTARLVARTIAVAMQGTEGLPGHELALFGGTTTAPGYDYHSLAGRLGVSQRVELQFRVPFVPVSLGRFGRAPASATLAPYVTIVGIETVPHFRRSPIPPASGEPVIMRRDAGFYPSIGVGVLTLFDLLRVDVARGLRGGRWTFTLDVTREFWRVL